MPIPLVIALLISILSFGWYGFSCLFSVRMKKEFKRYGLGHLRVLTGSLQVAAVLGQILGFYDDIFILLASMGLAAMMAVAFNVRISIKDPWKNRIPALFFLFLNLFIVMEWVILHKILVTDFIFLR